MAMMALQHALVLLCFLACQLDRVNCDVTDNMADMYQDNTDEDGMSRLFAEMYYKDMTNNLNQEAYGECGSIDNVVFQLPSRREENKIQDGGHSF